MQARDIDHFKEELEELADCLPGRQVTAGMIERYFEVLRPFTITLIHRACLVLLNDEARLQTFPAPAELKLVCLGLAREEFEEERGSRTEREIRCQHRSYDRPVGEDGERPPCATVIPWRTPGKDDGPEVYYCPAHRPQYRGEARATDEEIDRVLVDWLKQAPEDPFRQEVVANRATNQAQGQSVTRAALHGVLKAFTTKVYGRADTLKAMGGEDLGDVPHDPRVIKANARRRAEQLRLAEDAGLPVREPGEEG